MPDGRIFYGRGRGSAPAGSDEALLAFERFYDPRTGGRETVGPTPFGRRDSAGSVLLPMGPP